MDGRDKPGHDDKWTQHRPGLPLAIGRYVPHLGLMAKRSASVPNLFAAAGLDRDAPRPLADKLLSTQILEFVKAGK